MKNKHQENELTSMSLNFQKIFAVLLKSKNSILLLCVMIVHELLMLKQ